jgi:16S rRNA (adenine1518-N6/adenine1519-N6)-dimethyltransferase
MTTESPAEVLRRFKLKPKHSWGQNFLGDENALQEIADAAALGPGDVCVELGPGLGHLTRFLLETKARVVAVERDREMVAVLEEFALPGLTVIAGNAADVDFAKVSGADQVVVVGNLPYHLSSPILFEVLEQAAHVKRAVFTLQLEVVERLSAEPSTRAYGLLTVLLGLEFDIEHVATLGRHLFHPPPNVDSAVVKLTRRAVPRAKVTSATRFKQVVKACFAQRRKTLNNSIKSDKALAEKFDLKAALERAGIDGIRRAETLSVEEFAALERSLDGTP